MATLKEIIDRVDANKVNGFSEEEKTAWISTAEMQIAQEIFQTDGSAYDWDTDQDTELLLGPPFEDIYELYLMAQIDFRQGEFNRYNNELGQFSTRMTDAKAWYIRKYRPEKKTFRWFY